MTLTSKISKGLNLIALPYKTAQKHQKNALFRLFHAKALGTKFDLALKKDKVTIFIDFKELDPQMLYTKFQANQPSGSGEEKNFQGFNHTWTWQPSWSCDLD